MSRSDEMRAKTMSRYSRQEVLPEIGPEGQRRLGRATALIVGCGALGTTQADLLVRAGVGTVRIADRDVPELSNLQRQTLFDEGDVERGLPKAIAAAARLRKINGVVRVEPHVVDVTSRTVEELIEGVDVVLDGLDNFETRFLVNDVCVREKVPWIYGGVQGTCGTTLTVLPGEGACLRCLLPDPPPPGTLPTCDTAGVLNTIPAVVASLQVTAALKLLTGAAERTSDLYQIDLWSGDVVRVVLEADPSCPCCAEGRFDFLERRQTSWTTTLCGRDAVQITPAEGAELSLEELEARLRSAGVAVENKGFLLTLEVDGLRTLVFPDGRAVVQGTTDEALARTHYSRYIGA